jgi:hypothetical protein
MKATVYKIIFQHFHYFENHQNSQRMKANTYLMFAFDNRSKTIVNYWKIIRSHPLFGVTNKWFSCDWKVVEIKLNQKHIFPKLQVFQNCKILQVCNVCYLNCCDLNVYQSIPYCIPYLKIYKFKLTIKWSVIEIVIENKHQSWVSHNMIHELSLKYHPISKCLSCLSCLQC